MKTLTVDMTGFFEMVDAQLIQLTGDYNALVLSGDPGQMADKLGEIIRDLYHVRDYFYGRHQVSSVEAPEDKFLPLSSVESNVAFIAGRLFSNVGNAFTELTRLRPREGAGLELLRAASRLLYRGFYQIVSNHAVREAIAAGGITLLVRDKLKNTTSSSVILRRRANNGAQLSSGDGIPLNVDRAAEFLRDAASAGVLSETEVSDLLSRFPRYSELVISNTRMRERLSVEQGRITTVFPGYQIEVFAIIGWFCVLALAFALLTLGCTAYRGRQKRKELTDEVTALRDQESAGDKVATTFRERMDYFMTHHIGALFQSMLGDRGSQLAEQGRALDYIQRRLLELGENVQESTLISRENTVAIREQRATFREMGEGVIRDIEDLRRNTIARCDAQASSSSAAFLNLNNRITETNESLARTIESVEQIRDDAAFAEGVWDDIQRRVTSMPLGGLPITFPEPLPSGSTSVAGALSRANPRPPTTSGLPQNRVESLDCSTQFAISNQRGKDSDDNPPDGGGGPSSSNSPTGFFKDSSGHYVSQYGQNSGTRHRVLSARPRSKALVLKLNTWGERAAKVWRSNSVLRGVTLSVLSFTVVYYFPAAMGYLNQFLNRSVKQQKEDIVNAKNLSPLVRKISTALITGSSVVTALYLLKSKPSEAPQPAEEEAASWWDYISKTLAITGEVSINLFYGLMSYLQFQAIRKLPGPISKRPQAIGKTVGTIKSLLQDVVARKS